MILDLMIQGQQKNQAKHLGEETGKLGVLRGGSCGAIIGRTVLGKCPRQTVLRMLGVSDPPSLDKALMFEAGFMNELSLMGNLKASWPGVILRESQIPIKTEIDGVLLTGRPDFVLCNQQPNGAIIPEVGIELKNVSSIFTALAVGFKKEPKTDHIIQAGHYAMRLGINYSLLYISRMDWHVGGIGSWKWVKQCLGNAPSLLTYKGDDPLKINPFASEFLLRWKDDTLQYRHHTLDQWQTTLITKQSIDDYYKTIVHAVKNRVIPQKSSNKSVLGDDDYNQCDYCAFADVCKEHDDNFEAWVDHARQLINTKE